MQIQLSCNTLIFLCHSHNNLSYKIFTYSPHIHNIHPLGYTGFFNTFTQFTNFTGIFLALYFIAISIFGEFRWIPPAHDPNKHIFSFLFWIFCTHMLSQNRKIILFLFTQILCFNYARSISSFDFYPFQMRIWNGDSFCIFHVSNSQLYFYIYKKIFYIIPFHNIERR